MGACTITEECLVQILIVLFTEWISSFLWMSIRRVAPEAIIGAITTLRERKDSSMDI
jgi:hypothetical protein